jgi:hypothetical protein
MSNRRTWTRSFMTEKDGDTKLLRLEALLQEEHGQTGLRLHCEQETGGVYYMKSMDHENKQYNLCIWHNYRQLDSVCENSGSGATMRTRFLYRLTHTYNNANCGNHLFLLLLCSAYVVLYLLLRIGKVINKVVEGVVCIDWWQYILLLP